VVVGLIAILRVVPETKNPAPKRLDVTGLLVSITGLTLLIYGIIDASRTRDWLAPTVIGPIIAGIAIIGLFLWIEARSDHGSFDVGLFRNRGYAVSLVAVSFAFSPCRGSHSRCPSTCRFCEGLTRSWPDSVLCPLPLDS